jgi:sugar O-acyltransferase (sialic acid O-acetyltransferase NeuD family)
MQVKKVAIYGAGGFGREVACLIQEINTIENQWNLIGFFDDGIRPGSSNRYGKILGSLKDLNNWTEELNVVIAIGKPSIQSKLSASIQNTKIKFPNIVAPDVKFLDSESLSLGFGNIIGLRCILSCDVKIGNFNIFNSDVIVGHDSVMGNCNLLNPSVRISGQVIIGNENLFGVGSVVLQTKRIGNNTIISANSVIIRSTQDNSLYIGNPAIKNNF